MGHNKAEGENQHTQILFGLINLFFKAARCFLIKILLEFKPLVTSGLHSHMATIGWSWVVAYPNSHHSPILVSGLVLKL